MRILVAEDEKDMNRIICKRLKEEGYSVDSCFDGLEVFDYLACAEYDAIVLDIMMPRMDGLQVLRKLRADNNQIPVLLLTAKDRVEDRVTGLDAGGGRLPCKTVCRPGTVGQNPCHASKTCFC